MLVCSLDLILVAQIFPKMVSFCYFFGLPKLITLTWQFLYTDISVISVIFCNSDDDQIQRKMLRLLLTQRCHNHYYGQLRILSIEVTITQQSRFSSPMSLLDSTLQRCQIALSLLLGHDSHLFCRLYYVSMMK